MNCLARQLAQEPACGTPWKRRGGADEKAEGEKRKGLTLGSLGSKGEGSRGEGRAAGRTCWG